MKGRTLLVMDILGGSFGLSWAKKAVRAKVYGLEFRA